MARKVSKEKGSYASCFYHCFLESFKSRLLLLVALPSLTDTLLHSCYFEGPCYDCLWRGDKYSWYRNISSAQHRWSDLWHYIYCFVELEEAFTVKGNKQLQTQTHTDTDKTQTHTHTHTLQQQQHQLITNIHLLHMISFWIVRIGVAWYKIVVAAQKAFKLNVINTNKKTLVI